MNIQEFKNKMESWSVSTKSKNISFILTVFIWLVIFISLLVIKPIQKEPKYKEIQIVLDSVKKIEKKENLTTEKKDTLAKNQKENQQVEKSEPKETKEMLRQFDFKTGKTDIDLKVINNRPFSDIELNDVTITYLPLELPFKIINGQIQLKNDKVYLNKINTLADDMPIFINGEIKNLYSDIYHDIYINSGVMLMNIKLLRKEQSKRNKSGE